MIIITPSELLKVDVKFEEILMHIPYQVHININATAWMALHVSWLVPYLT